MKEFRFFSEDKRAYAIFLFFLILLADSVAVVLGFGGAVVIMFALGSDPMFSTYESLVISSCAICLVLLTALYSYRINHPKKLKAIAAANIIMSLLPIMMNSLYYPFTDMLLHVIYRITGIEFFNFSLFSDYTAELISLPFCILCFILLIKLKERKEEGAQKVSFRRTVQITVTVLSLVTVAGLAICNIPVSESYNTSGIANIAEWAETVIDNYTNKSRAEKLFEIITGDTDYSQARESVKDTKAVSVYPSENGKVKIKKITYSDTVSSDKTDEAKESFEKLRMGEEKETVLKEMKKVSDVTAVSVEYGENTVREAYELSAFCDISFLSLIEMEWFNGTVVFENGILTDGNYTYTLETNADTDDVVCTEEKYTITE